MLPFFDEQGIAVSCVLTDRGRRVLTHASLAEQLTGTAVFSAATTATSACHTTGAQ
jgi:hypothetical protein